MRAAPDYAHRQHAPYSALNEAQNERLEMSEEHAIPIDPDDQNMPDEVKEYLRKLAEEQIGKLEAQQADTYPTIPPAARLQDATQLTDQDNITNPTEAAAHYMSDLLPDLYGAPFIMRN